MFGAVFGIGFTEMILVGIVILLLFSPRELPGMMKSIAKVYGSIRRTAEEFRAQVMEADELREPIEEIRAAYHGTKQELLSAQDLARRELGRARSEAMKAQQKLAELAREESRRDAPALAAPVHPPVTTPATPATSPLKGRVSASDKLDDDHQPAVNAAPSTRAIPHGTAPAIPPTTPSATSSAMTPATPSATSSATSSAMPPAMPPAMTPAAASAPQTPAPASPADRSDAA